MTLTNKTSRKLLDLKGILGKVMEYIYENICNNGNSIGCIFAGLVWDYSIIGQVFFLDQNVGEDPHAYQ